MKQQLKQAVNHFRGQLASRQAHDAQHINATHTSTVATVQQQLHPLYEQIGQKQQTGEEVSLSWLYEGGKLEAVKQAVESAINQFGTFAKTIVQNSLSWASRLAGQAAHLFLKAQGPEQVFRAADQGAISGVLNRVMDQLGHLFGGFGAEAVHEVAGVLIRGVSLGSKVKEIADEIMQKLDISRQRSLAISATLPAQTFKETTLEEYKANEDKVIGWIWICSLRKNSCLACVAMHGTVHDLREMFHDHPNGHCQAIPRTENSPIIQQGANWLAEQKPEIQRAIWGSQIAYELYRDGIADVQDFIGFRYDPQWGMQVYQRSAKEVLKEKAG